MKLCLLLIVSLTLLLCVCGDQSLDPVTKGLVQQINSMRDATVNPCDNFYEYACGQYIKKNPAPNTTEPYIFIPSISGISITNDKVLSEIVTGPWPFANDLYESCMRTEKSMKADRILLVNKVAAHIKSINTSDFSEVQRLTAYLDRHGVDQFINFEIQQYNDVDTIVLMPRGSSRDNYDNLIQTIINVQTLDFGYDPSTAKQNAVNIDKVDLWLATNSNETTELNTTVSNLNSVTGLDFDGIILPEERITWKADVDLIVVNPNYFRALKSVITLFSAEEIQQYLIWKVMEATAYYNLSECTGPDGYDCNFISDFYVGSPPYSQEVVCRYAVNDFLGDYVGLIFSAIAVNDEVVDDIKDMTTGIQKAFGSSLGNLSWMDAESVKTVEFKLDNILQIIGHPNVLDKYEDLVTTPNSFYENLWNIISSTHPYYLNAVAEPTNRSDTNFPPLLVNAFYDPSTNTINFPAGILESPMFSVSWPKLFQYARLGYVVGHENTHGFDNEGSRFDAFGNPGDIFDNSTRAKFNENSLCIADFYSNFIAYQDVHVNGLMTLPENIADIGGVKNSYRAYQNFLKQNGGPEFDDGELIPGLTTEQVFFLFMGQTWCTSENEAYLEFEVEYDVHSPSEWRVNGPLAQFSEFAAAWSCPATSAMNPKDRCDLW